MQAFLHLAAPGQIANWFSYINNISCKSQKCFMQVWGKNLVACIGQWHRWTMQIDRQTDIFATCTSTVWWNSFLHISYLFKKLWSVHRVTWTYGPPGAERIKAQRHWWLGLKLSTFQLGAHSIKHWATTAQQAASSELSKLPESTCFAKILVSCGSVVKAPVFPSCHGWAIEQGL